MSDANALVSIVIPCYNAAPYLEACVESVLAQSCPRYEVIIVNDGSTDDTASVLNKFLGLAHVRIIHQNNTGISGARNKGLACASGKYILFVDADDTIQHNLVERAIGKAEDSGADAVFFGYKTVVIHNDNRPDSEYTCIPREERVNGNAEVIFRILPRFIGTSRSDIQEWYTTKKLAPDKEFASVFRFLYRKSILDKYGIRFDENILFGEDTIFNSHYLSHCCSFVSINASFYNYHSRPTGTLNSCLRNGEKLANGKLALLGARVKLRNVLLSQKGIDVSDLYAGSNILSALQLANELSLDRTKSISLNYRLFREYANSDAVKTACNDIALKGAPLKFRIPVGLLKIKASLVVFMSFAVINRMGIPVKM